MLTRVNPFIRYAKMHCQGWPSQERSVCYDCRLFGFVSGEGMLYADGGAYAFSPGACIFLPAGTRYRFVFSSPEQVRAHVLDFDVTDDRDDLTHSIGTATEESYEPLRCITVAVAEFAQVIVSKADTELQGHVAACTELFFSKTPYYREAASAHLKLALLGLLDGSRRQEHEYRLMQRVQTYIRQNCQDPRMNNRTVAEHLSYHPYYISRLMKQHTGKTMHEYMIGHRLHLARTYLVTTDLRVTEIAERSGFASYTYFIKLFRERMGASPLQYRKMHRSVGP